MSSSKKQKILFNVNKPIKKKQQFLYNQRIIPNPIVTTPPIQNIVQNSTENDIKLQNIVQNSTENDIKLKILNPNNFDKTPSNNIVSIQPNIYLFSPINNIKESLKNQTLQPDKIINNFINKYDKFNDDHLIIYTDNILEDKNTILYFSLSYQLYHYDCAFVDNSSSNQLFYDNYNGNVNCNRAFAFRYKYFKNLENYDEEYLTNYYQTNNLYAVGLNFGNVNNTFEHKYNKDYYFNTPSLIYNFTKNNLINVKDLFHEYKENNSQVDIKYFNENTLIATLTPIIEENYNEEYKFNFQNKSDEIIIPNMYSKSTYLIEINNKISYYENKEYLEVFQINNDNVSDMIEFYKTLTVINYNKYGLFKNYTYSDIDNYIQSRDPLINKIYNIIESNSLKVLLFKILKLYEENTIYIKNNSIQYNHINILIDNILYVDTEDLNYDDSIIYLNKFSKMVFSSLLKIILARLWQKVSHITYGKLWGRQMINLIIPNELRILNCKDNLIVDKNNILFFKLSKNNFEEDYEKDKNNNNLFKKLSFSIDQFKGIDKIVWINLDKSIERKQNIENTLENINILNERISAVNGNDDITKYSTPINKDMDNNEKACTLSHFKAYANLKKSEGNYFLVCEDDVMLDSIILYDINIDQVIKDAPKNFDIMILHALSTNLSLKPNLYSKKQSFSSACYIITKTGVDKLNKIIDYNENQDKFMYTKEAGNLGITDTYIYKFVNTYEYKYNLVSTIYIDSTIRNVDINDKNKYNLSKDNNILKLNLNKIGMYIFEYFQKNNKFMVETISDYKSLYTKFIQKYGGNDINDRDNLVHYEMEKIDFYKWKLGIYQIINNKISNGDIYLFDEKVNKNIETPNENNAIKLIKTLITYSKKIN